MLPPGVKVTRVGGRISRDRLPPGGQANHGWLAPRGATCPGGKINWDTGTKFREPYHSNHVIPHRDEQGRESCGLNDRVHGISCRYSDTTCKKINYISTNTYFIIMQ